jgi:hypothetical protein
MVAITSISSPEALLVEAGAGVVLGQDALEARVVALDGHHGVVHQLADVGLLRVGLQVGLQRARLRHPEDVLGLVFVRVFGVRALVVALTRLVMSLARCLLEAVGDVLEEDQARGRRACIPPRPCCCGACRP